MRIALVSDIHGNWVAFQAVLADIQNARIDRTICLGDVAVNGPQPHEVLDRLQELAWPVVRGNTDDWFLTPQTFDSSSEKERRMMELLQGAKQQLAPADLDMLRTFEPRIEISLDQETTPGPNGRQTLLAYHGSPRSNTDAIFAATPDAELEPLFDGWQATVMAGGHTHVQMLRCYRGALVVGVGSVGMPVEPGAKLGENRRPPWAEYAIVDSQGERLGIEFRRVPVDKARMVQAVRESGMPHQDWWIKGLI